jgi:hypothetical protein
MLRAAGLWRKTSAAGNEYFAGRLGGVKIIILSNRDRGKDDSQPTHYLFFVDGESRQDNARPAARSERPARPRNVYARSGRPAERPPVRPDAVPMPDDPVDDLWRRGEP